MLSEAHDNDMDLKYRMFTGGTAGRSGILWNGSELLQSGVYLERLNAFSVKQSGSSASKYEVRLQAS